MTAKGLFYSFDNVARRFWLFILFFHHSVDPAEKVWMDGIPIKINEKYTPFGFLNCIYLSFEGYFSQKF